MSADVVSTPMPTTPMAAVTSAAAREAKRPIAPPASSS
jgi:hypothetical protein